MVKITSKASADSPIARRRGQTEIETALTASGLNHTLLRGNGYMQNLLLLAPAIASTSRFASSTGSGRVGFIDARDIAAVATRIAGNPREHAGKTYGLSGPQALTYGQVADIFTTVLGRAVTFETRSADEDAAAMIDAGVPTPVAQMNAQAFALIADGDAEWLTDTVRHVLGRDPRSLEQFVRDHQEAFSSTATR